LAAHLAGLGLGADDVVAIQLLNWNEFPVAVNAAMLAGIPFCQFHGDFRNREVEFILGFTEASALILPRQFRRFDYLAMIERLRPSLPHLRHVMVVGEDVPPGYFDLRGFRRLTTSLIRGRRLIFQRRLPNFQIACKRARPAVRRCR
jgi:non-ribosomal peptide synthetase component E (peptide arylation enzyme)